MGAAVLSLLYALNPPAQLEGRAVPATVESPSLRPEGPREVLERRHAALDQRRRGGWLVGGGVAVMASGVAVIGSAVYLGVLAGESSGANRAAYATGSAGTGLLGIVLMGGSLGMIDAGGELRREADAVLTVVPTFGLARNRAQFGVAGRF